MSGMVGRVVERSVSLDWVKIRTEGKRKQHGREIGVADFSQTSLTLLQTTDVTSRKSQT